jgi:glycosyltransferase involved in cell wall biosynthesis
VRIVQYLGGAGSWGGVNPEIMAKQGLGGRESALVNLSERWADMGHEVINFVPAEKSLRYPRSVVGSSHYLSNKRLHSYVADFGCDVLVSWEEPRVFDVDDIVNNTKLKVIEMQVANLTHGTRDSDDRIDAYAVLSEWAGKFLLEQDAGVDPDKLVVFPNGVDLNRYDNSPRNYDLDIKQFYYSSSPDRGLNHLLKMWPDIRSEFPNSVLHVCYGIEHWANTQKWSHMKTAEMALDVIDGIKLPGVMYHGKVGQDYLAEIQMQCDALLYPCDPIQPTETGCITIVEAGASFSPAVTTSADCLESEFRDYTVMNDLPLDYDSYIESLTRLMSSDKLYEWHQTAGRSLAEKRSWGKIAAQWVNYFEDHVD